MTTIEAYRAKPISRPGAVERTLAAFGIGPYITTLPWQPSEEAGMADETPYPEGYRSKFSWDEREDGSDITITIDLADEDAARAKDLIQALRFCGFVAGIESA